jgi:aspartyl protease family protein
LYWALGVVASVSLFAVTSPKRLMSAVGGSPPPKAAAAVASPAQPAGNRTLVLHADFRGHYTAHANINGTTIRTMVDTGATIVALSHDDARTVGAHKLRPIRRTSFSTANGVVSGSIIRLDEVRVGDLVVRDVEAAVMPPGALGVTLLGMSFLRGLDGFEVSKGKLVMRK